jgi:DNA-binding NarL/FixJ family response regulator
MIVCAIDDLLFSVKISTAAKRLGAEVYFERSAGRLLDTLREKRPGLVIFDLNSAAIRPVDAVGLIKSDPDLRRLRTLGFVAHVDARTTAAARAAGIDRVLARSAFVAELDTILTSA